MTRYSKRMVIIHWLTLVLVIAAWFLGDSLADATDDGKATLAGYVVHILAGGSIVLLTLMRLYFRSKDGMPPFLNDKPIFSSWPKLFMADFTPCCYWYRQAG